MTFQFKDGLLLTTKRAQMICSTLMLKLLDLGLLPMERKVEEVVVNILDVYFIDSMSKYI